MGSREYIELKEQMNRIEALLSQLVAPVPVAAAPDPLPVPMLPDVTETDSRKRLQAEGRFILDSQGMEAYKRFWKMQARKDDKPRLRKGRAA